MRLLSIFLFLGLSTSLVHSQVLFDFGTTGNTFGQFGSSPVQASNTITADGTVSGFDIIVAASRGAFDLTSFDLASSVDLTASSGSEATLNSASLRLVDNTFALVARWNFDPSSLSSSLSTVSLGTLGAPDITGGGDASNITAIVFQAETNSPLTFDLTVDSVSLSPLTAVPEPSFYASMFGLSALVLVLIRRRMQS